MITSILALNACQHACAIHEPRRRSPLSSSFPFIARHRTTLKRQGASNAREAFGAGEAEGKKGKKGLRMTSSCSEGGEGGRERQRRRRQLAHERQVDTDCGHGGTGYSITQLPSLLQRKSKYGEACEKKGGGG